MLSTCRVNKLAADICHHFAFVELAHMSSIRNVGYMSNLHVVFTTIRFKCFAIFSLNHNSHTLLRFANSQFCRIQARIFGRYTIQIDIQSVSQLTDGYTYSTCSEVI